MSDADESSRADEAVAQQAAAWVLRCDRGLTPAEQDELSTWLAADPRHGAQLARHRRHWRRLDALADWRPEHATRPNPDLLAPPLRARIRPWAVATTLAAAAAVVLGIYVFRALQPTGDPLRSGPGAAIAHAPPPRQRVLPDGSKVELNQGAEFSVEFTPTERRVHFERGEAHFFVEKDPQRPFIVNAAGIDVRAVGTAFNVRIDPSAVEVLVTEGKVRVDSAATTADPAAPAAVASAPLIPVLEARQRAVVPLQPAIPATSGPQAPSPQIATLTPREIERVLSWQHRMLDFTATPISEIVTEFNRRNVTQLAVLDPELASIRMNATLRSDNIDGFVRLLEAGFGVRAEKRGDSEILLRKNK
jgi:transmembrane sensor